ncbi:MAG: sigma-54 dependent transcriptional regulator [Gammaproteobacteria bacterium]|nr:sigma-54 dependent transcriptional regulator [Gammaproteobacteria bacterium]
MSHTNKIIFVDDEAKAGELVQRFCQSYPFESHVFTNPLDALEYYRSEGADLIISDLRMPQMTGIELLKSVRVINKDVPFIIISGYANTDNAIEAMRLGASDFIKKPYDMDELLLLIEKTLGYNALVEENRLLRQQLNRDHRQSNMVGRAPALQHIYELISKIADIRCNVIIEGESGTGKELAAHAIHFQSQHAEQPFVVIDCGALTDTLLESELFGYEKGAFTGAQATKKGLLETASGGTVFLDEIGNISDAMQIKLMRAIQEQQIVPVGGVRPIHIDVRFIVATNRHLDEMVKQGQFRHDLYHRLNVVKFSMPALREHPEDIPELVQHFIDELASQYRRDISGFDPESMQKLLSYSWPGNIRELRNLIERHIVLADSPQMHITESLEASSQQHIDSDFPSLEALEQRYILKVLEHCQNNKEKTAAVLGINKSTLWRKLQHYQSS